MFRAPRPTQLPPFEILCRDVGTDGQIARYLNVHERTLRRWKHRGAPRAAHLALYWESGFGMAALEAERGNLIAHYHALAGMHERAADKLRAVVLRLEDERLHCTPVAANSPFMAA